MSCPGSSAKDPHPELDELLRPQAQVSHTVRRLRWFKSSFRSHADEVAQRTGLSVEVDDRHLVATFIGWLRLFEAQKPSAPNLKRDYVGFAAGLMLRSMLENSPVEASASEAVTLEPAHFWPEGYVYAGYCLNMRSKVLAQDFGEPQAEAAAFADMNTWRSFRENVTQDVYLSTAFLDLFAGDKPNWEITRSFVARRG